MTIRWLSLVLLTWPGAWIPPVQAENLAASAAAIDRAAAPFVQAGDFMGVIAVHRHGETVTRSFGSASVELDVENTVDHRFLVGSISKQFTAAAILLLEADGKLSCDDLLSRHLPRFKPGQPITIGQLLRHKAGVADVYSLELFGATGGSQGDFDEVLQALNDAPLTHEPGSRHLYSNGGYSVAAAVIERVSGVSYEQFLEKRLFRPLGLNATYAAREGPVVERQVRGYDPWGINGLSAAPPVAPAFLKGSGSIGSSAHDLVAWNKALHGGSVLAPAQYAKLIDDRDTGYALGLSVFQRFGRRTFGHDGRLSGFASDAAHYPDEDTTIVVLGNVQSVARDEIRRRVAAVVFGENMPEWTAPRLMPTKGLDLNRYAGRYQFGPGFVVVISVASGRLLARANEGGYSELLPVAGGGWFSRLLYAHVSFQHDDNDAVTALVWGGSDSAPIGTRLSGAGMAGSD